MVTDVAPAVTAQPSGPAYELTKEEKALDCRRLTGRMKVRAAVMRSQAGAAKPSAVASVGQTAATTVFGGTRRSADPDADYRVDRARLEAYNRRLAELKCPTLDIDAELKGKPSPPAAKPAPKPATPKAEG